MYALFTKEHNTKSLHINVVLGSRDKWLWLALGDAFTESDYMHCMSCKTRRCVTS